MLGQALTEPPVLTHQNPSLTLILTLPSPSPSWESGQLEVRPQSAAEAAGVSHAPGSPDSPALLGGSRITQQ